MALPLSRTKPLSAIGTGVKPLCLGVVHDDRGEVLLQRDGTGEGAVHGVAGQPVGAERGQSAA
jgi:hypothetical protein